MHEQQLNHLFKKIIKKVPPLLNEEQIEMNKINLPNLTKKAVELNQLLIKKNYINEKQAYKLMYLDFYADKQCYLLLALMILTLVFKTKLTTINIRLTHPDSDFKTIMIQHDYQLEQKTVTGYVTKPYSFKYRPEKLKGLNFENHKVIIERTVEDSPVIALQTGEPCLMVGGSDVSLVILAKLLLDFSHPRQIIKEIEAVYSFKSLLNHVTQQKSLTINFCLTESGSPV